MDADKEISEIIDQIVRKALYTPTSSISELVTFSELVDRLTIVNQKLYCLKDEVMRRKDDKGFCAEAAIKDVALVMERSRIKKAIDEKIILLINGQSNRNLEVKNYG